MGNTIMPTSTYTGQSCNRCGRTDLPILSNGLCTRCDYAVYGKKVSDW